MPSKPSSYSLSANRPIRYLRLLLVAGIAAFAVFFIAFSIHWPMMDDSPIMHYVNFLMAHGLRPYSDISDNNLPGAYFVEGWAMDLFGPTDLAWRIYEFFLLALLIAAATLITLPFDWFAGFLAGSLFLIVHAAEGPRFTAEREQVITVLLLIAYAALFAAIRRRQPPLMLVFGLATALAGSIKPTFAPLAILLLVFAALVLRRRKVPATPYILWAVLGFAAIFALVLRFLLHYGVLAQFLFILRVVTPSYVGLRHPALSYLLFQTFPRTLLPLIPAAIALFVVQFRAQRSAWNWERWALLLGAAFGLFSFFAQQKGFYHHRYTWLAFFFLLCCIEFSTALRRAGWPRLLACAALLYILGVAIPRYTLLMRNVVSHSDLTTQLERDLTAIGGGHPGHTLQRQVECFDLVSGCLNTLYHLNLVENTGFTGDLMTFRRQQTPVVRFYRDELTERFRANPPAIMVVTNEWFGESDTFDKLDTWPAFVDMLARQYTLVETRDFPMEGFNSPPPTPQPTRAYRIYIRNGTPLLPAARLALQ